MLFRNLQKWLRGRQKPVPTVLDAQVGIAVLNEQAPLKTETVNDEDEEVFLCREAILGRDQRIAGYQFMLQENTISRLRVKNSQTAQLYTEILIRNLVNAELGSLLGHRLAFIDIPDTFLQNTSLQDLSPPHTVLCLDYSGLVSPDSLQTQIRQLRTQGFRIAISDPDITPQLSPLLPLADVVILYASKLDAQHGLTLASHLSKQAPQAQILIRELQGMEDFRFSCQLGANLFQGPFITSREKWHDHHLSAAQTNILLLLQKLGQDADIQEIVALIKKDPAISLRLLRYINSAANGLTHKISSIGNALTVLGRAQLCRWLTLLLCISGERPGRSEAALENALTRARMMELLGRDHPSVSPETLFLTGLLSLVDVILQEPMETALSSLAIVPDISKAILHREGPCADFLDLAIACEQHDAEKIKLVSARCSLTLPEALTAHTKALQWTLAIQAEFE